MEKTDLYSSKHKIGGRNIISGDELKPNVRFNETYIVVGDVKDLGDAEAMYNLTFIGNVKAANLVVQGDLYIEGNINAQSISCKSLVCSGNIDVNTLYCTNVYANNIKANDKITASDNIVSSGYVSARTSCEVRENLYAPGGITVQGTLQAGTAIAGDLDCDQKTEATVFLIHEVEPSSPGSEEKSQEDLRTTARRVESEIEEEVRQQKPRQKIAKLWDYAQMQPLSFEEERYLINELYRILQDGEIENYKDYLIVSYLDEYNEMLSEDEKKKAKILLSQVDAASLKYSTSSLYDFAYSLKIVSASEDLMDSEAPSKVFSLLGVRYQYLRDRGVFEG